MEGEEESMFTRPVMKNDRTDVTRQTINISQDEVMQSLGEDNAVEFASMLKSKEKGKHAVEMVFKTRLSTFHNIRILTLWYLLGMDGEAVVSPKLEDIEEMFSYLIEGWEEDTIKETRKHIINTAINPSHFWILALKQFWDDSMTKGLYQVFHRSPSTIRSFNTVITDYHSIHKPYVTYKDGAPSIAVPSKWFRAVIYPFFGGEPSGVYDDSPMSYEDSLRDVFSNYKQ